MGKIGKRFAAGATATALALALAACGSDGGDDDSDDNAGGDITPGGSLTYYVTAPLGHADPARIYTGRDLANFRKTVYRSLVAFPSSDDATEASTPVADLATDTGTSSDGGKVWSFTVKDGVKWQDGKDITCEDFKYGASRVFATDVITGGPNYLLAYLDIPKGADGLPAYHGPYTGEGQDLYDKAVTCDGKTITYHFNKPWPDFPLAVASLMSTDPYRQDLDKGDQSNFTINSNGPYMLDGSLDPEKGWKFVRNTSYDASTDDESIRKALPDTIVFDYGQAPETIYDLIFADSGDAKTGVTAQRIPPAYLPKVTGNVTDRYLNTDSPYSDYLVPNVKRLDPAVREALAVATNKTAWITAGGGEKFYVPSYSIVNTQVAGYKDNPAFKDLALEGDTEKAKQILTDAGKTLPVPIKFTYDGSTDVATKQAAALKDTWDKAGFTVTLDPLQDAYYPTIQKPDSDTDITWAGWGADWPSAITVTPPLFDSRINLTKNSNGQDYGNYASDEFNAAVDQAANAADLDAQTAALQDADGILGKDFAYIPLEQSLFNWAWGSDVLGFKAGAAVSNYPDLGVIGVKH